jgi:hypothetical protein
VIVKGIEPFGQALTLVTKKGTILLIARTVHQSCVQVLLRHVNQSAYRFRARLQGSRIPSGVALRFCSTIQTHSMSCGLIPHRSRAVMRLSRAPLLNSRL